MPAARACRSPARSPTICSARRHFARASLVALFALAAVAAPSALATERPADRSLADAAHASLAGAATRMLDGTREVAMFALSLVGIDYRYGGDTPDRGLDCSGLIRYVFQEVTGVALPRTSRELARIGTRVRTRDLEPGDLVFFNTRHFPNSHVGIYLGDDRFIHAPSRGGEVGVATLSAKYWQKRYNGARRLVGVLPTLVPGLIPQAHANPPDVARAAVQPPTPVAPATASQSSASPAEPPLP